jgi:hypothetical protein
MSLFLSAATIGSSVVSAEDATLASDRPKPDALTSSR